MGEKHILKSVTRVCTSKLDKKVDLASLKSKTDKLDVVKLDIIPADLKKLSDAVDKEVGKKRTCVS